MARSTGTDKLFVKRLYYPRIVGMALAFIFVAAVLYQHKEGMLLWAVCRFHRLYLAPSGLFYCL